MEAQQPTAGALPTYTYNRVTYFVDYRMQQFRSVSFNKAGKLFKRPIRFYDFRSHEGDRILSRMIRDGVADINRLRL